MIARPFFIAKPGAARSRLPLEALPRLRDIRVCGQLFYCGRRILKIESTAVY